MLTVRIRRVVPVALAASALFAAVAAAGPSRTPSVLSSRWDATVVVNGVEIPFPFEITRRGGRTVGSFFNGERRISSTATRVDGDRVIFTFAQYGTTLDALVSDGRLSGEYRRGDKSLYPFSAVPAGHARGGAGAPVIDGTWIVQARSAKGESAWRFIAHQESGRVTATILRVDGDTGTLAGSFEDGRYVLSHFSGARPLLVEVFPIGDGTMRMRRTSCSRTRRSTVRTASMPPVGSITADSLKRSP